MSYITNLVKISTVVASNQASVVFTSGFSLPYAYFQISVSGLQVVQSGGTSMLMRMSTNGGSSYDSGANYSYSQRMFDSAAGNNWNRSSVGTSITCIVPIPTSGTTTDNGGMFINLYSLASATQYKLVEGVASIIYGTTLNDQRFNGSYNSITAVNAIQFIASTGNIFAGTFTLYGVS